MNQHNETRSKIRHIFNFPTLDGTKTRPHETHFSDRQMAGTHSAEFEYHPLKGDGR
jgi:hypothetical protein